MIKANRRRLVALLTAVLAAFGLCGCEVGGDSEGPGALLIDDSFLRNPELFQAFMRVGLASEMYTPPPFPLHAWFQPISLSSISDVLLVWIAIAPPTKASFAYRWTLLIVGLQSEPIVIAPPLLA